MKTVLEEITPDPNSSFRLMINPDLSDFFFWHFHPEYELVLLEGASGNRHVGDHFSSFEGGDLVFIGSYIPHLNFDFGIRTSYEKYVVHIHPDFLNHALLHTPELAGIRDLFDASRHGVAFNKAARAGIGDRIRKLGELGHFEQFISILEILQELSNPALQELLHPEPYANVYTKKDEERLKSVYAFVDQHYERQIQIREVASLCNLTNEAFCRYFKKMTRLTFTAFVNHYRIDIAKKLLLQHKNVSEACFESGFESLSYFNRTFKKITGKNPSAFRKTAIR